LGGDTDDRKSTTGIIFFLGQKAVAWQSQKQRVVALSSCEAEYIAGAGAACQAVWLARLLKDITGDDPQTPQLKMDNMAATHSARTLYCMIEVSTSILSSISFVNASTREASR
jgi:hypothetical protein